MEKSRARGPRARLRSRRVFAREMERKLGLDGGSNPHRIEIKAARKIYAIQPSVTFRKE